MAAGLEGTDQSLSARRWYSLFVVAGLIGLVWILSDGFVIAVPAISHDLGGSTDQMAWVVNIFTIVGCTAALFGRLGDAHGARRLVAVGILILIGGSVIGGLAQSPDILIIARALQGVGGIAMFTCGLALITHQFPPEERSKALSVRSVIAYVASGSAVLILALVLSGLGWRWIFWSSIAVAAVGLLLLAVTTTEFREPKSNKRLDLVGAATLSSSFLVLNFALIESDELSFLRLLILLAVSALLLTFFVRAESQAADPLIPPSVWRQTTFTGSIIVTFLYGVVLNGVLFLLALYLQTVRGLSAIDAAAVLMGATLAIIVANPLGAGLVKRGRLLLPVVAGMVLVAVASSAILVGVQLDSTPVILIGLVGLGLSIGVQMTALSVLQVTSAGATKGTASGVVGIVTALSVAMGIAIATAVMENVAVRSLRGETGSNQLEGVSHQRLLDILSGGIPLDSLSAAGQTVVKSAFDAGMVAACVAFVLFALIGVGVALKLLRNIALDDD
ncbi:MAG: MFS transporter [Solirubrobacteraceae bacterium]|nr:MFS transporter [Solirubrobacteraceae bacterium]